MTSDEKRIIAVDGAGGVAILAGAKARMFIADDIYADPMSVPDDAWREIAPVGIAPDTDHSTGNRRQRRAAEAKERKRR